MQKYIDHAAALMSENESSYQTTPVMIGGLRTHTASVSPETPMNRVIREFENNPDLPGVLVSEVGQYRGVISRRKVYERLSRPYGVELFLKHPVARFYHDVEISQTPLASRMRVEDAVRLALGRSGGQIYEPLVVAYDDGKLSLLDMQVLLMAQSQLLVNANRVVNQLFKVSGVLSSSLDVNIVLDAILDYMAETIPYDRCVILFFKDKQVDFLALRGFPAQVDMRQLRQVVLENSVYEAVRYSKQPMCIDDVLAHKEWPHLPHLPIARTWLGIPLVYAGEVSGILVTISLEPDAYTEEQINLAQKLAEQAAIALRNAMLFKEVSVFNKQLETTVKERTEDVAATLQKLEAVDQNKTEFLKIVAGEIADPLKKINGHLQFLNARAKSTQDAVLQDIFGSIADGIKRLEVIGEKIEDVAIIDSNDFNIKQDAVDIAQLFRKLHEEFSSDLQERHISLNLGKLDQLPDLCGDAHMLRKVFFNLIENAIQHTPDGGKITVIAVHRLTLDKQQVRSEIEITVSDTGTGIDPKAQKQIFDKGYRRKPPRNARKNSSDVYAGLGLAIVQGIVNAHGGRIWVESRGRDIILHHGSHFHVLLPAMQGSGKSATTLPIGAML